MPYVSVIVPTMRAGGIDVLVDSLAEQTFRDFELVLADGLHGHRAERVAAYAKHRGVRVVHVAPEPNPFPVTAFCAYANAGLVHASGEVALFCVDYTSLRPDVVERHAAFHRRAGAREGLMGPHRYAPVHVDPWFPRYTEEQTERYAEDLRVGKLNPYLISIGQAWDPEVVGSHPPLVDPKNQAEAGPIAATFFHAKNESIRLERAIEINGWDEELDGTHCWQDSDFADRLTVVGGVKWTVDPTLLVDIKNPRGIFPFGARLRPYLENEQIWKRKQAAGYPEQPNRWNLRDRRARAGVGVIDDPGVGRVVEEKWSMRTLQGVDVEAHPMRVVMIYGHFASAIHGPFEIDGLYTRTGLTGSESSFFNLARSLAEMGHEVAVICDCTAPATMPEGVSVMPLQTVVDLPKLEGVEVVIAWNEPDYLQYAPAGALRICDQQLNDFGYCRVPEWRTLVDAWVSPSHNHMHNVMAEAVKGTPRRIEVIPNSVDLGLFEAPPPARDPHRVVWCSSPDRGLHHLLAMWTTVRRREPGATLRVFYRLAPWLDRAREIPDEAGRRARFIEAALPRLAEHGVEVLDSVPNVRMAEELRRAAVLAYPCDPIRYTEGFGCSVLDAAAAGCLPVISPADALGEVHGSAALVVQQHPSYIDSWANAIYRGFTDRPEREADMAAHAAAHDRHKIAAAWVRLIGSEISRRRA